MPNTKNYKSLGITPDVYDELTKARARLELKTGKRLTISQVVQMAIASLYQKSREAREAREAAEQEQSG